MRESIFTLLFVEQWQGLHFKINLLMQDAMAFDDLHM